MSTFPGASNVHVESGLPGFSVAFDVEKWGEDKVVVRGVDILDEHTDPDAPEHMRDFSGERFEAIVRNTQASIDANIRPMVIIGHTDDADFRELSGPELAEKEMNHPLVGFVRRVEMSGTAPNRVMLGDFVFSREFFEHDVARNRYPRRSAEIDLTDLRLYNVALLGATLQARPLQDMLFGAAPRAVARFSKPWQWSERDMSTTLEAIQALEPRFDKLAEMLESLPAKFSAAMAKMQSEDKPADDDDKAKNQDDDDEDDDDKAKEECVDKETAKAQGSPDSAKYASLILDQKKLQAKLAEMEKQNATLARRAAFSEVQRRIAKLQDDGIILPEDDDLKDLVRELVDMPEARRDREFAKMAKHWSRVPVDSVYLDGADPTVTLDNEDDANFGSVSDQNDDVARFQDIENGIDEYCKQNGTPRWKAQLAMHKASR